MNPVKCSFIGLGKMGRELCARIGEAGFRTLAYDISQEASKFAEENLENVTSSELTSAVKNSDIVFSCLPNSKHVREIVDTLLKQKGTLVNVQYWVDTTSGNPGESQRIASDLKSQHELVGYTSFGLSILDNP